MDYLQGIKDYLQGIKEIENLRGTQIKSMSGMSDGILLHSENSSLIVTH